jgi:hypothetical protein
LDLPRPTGLVYSPLIHRNSWTPGQEKATAVAINQPSYRDFDQNTRASCFLRAAMLHPAVNLAVNGLKALFWWGPDFSLP